MTDGIRFFASMVANNQRPVSKTGSRVEFSVSGEHGLVRVKFWRERGVERWRVTRGTEVMAEGEFK